MGLVRTTVDFVVGTTNPDTPDDGADFNVVVFTVPEPTSGTPAVGIDFNVVGCVALDGYRESTVVGFLITTKQPF